MSFHAAYDRTLVFHGDCLEVLRGFADASIDAVVTDPPYGLGFMGKAWDKPGRAARESATDDKLGATPYGRARAEYGGAAYGRSHAAELREFQGWCTQWAAECLRVLKPGGHLLAFGGTRTYHRLASGVEDAGFELRDAITWLYGSGFPKGLDVGKAVDKAAGTPEAQQWAGWGTALKPASEPIVVARKPLRGTVAANVLEFGTGALNIAGCRVAGDEDGSRNRPPSRLGSADTYAQDEWTRTTVVQRQDTSGLGRWPANVVLTHGADCEPDGTHTVPRNGHHPATRGAGGVSTTGHGGQVGLVERGTGVETVERWRCTESCPVAELDAQSGIRPAGGKVTGRQSARTGAPGIYGDYEPQENRPYGDTGGASRFFPTFRYQAKAPAKERPKVDGVAHPTVKPLALMQWLVRLVTPPGGVVLDPFAGSGTTAQAAALEGFACAAIEREPAYLPLIDARLRKIKAGTA